MQATATMTTPKRRKLFPLAAGIGLLAILSVIAFVNWKSGSGSEAAQRPAVSVASQAAVDARFRAINELPVSAVSDRPAIVNHRFLDMNVLPEAHVAAGTLTGQALYRFLEWNQAVPGGSQGAIGNGPAIYPENDRDGRAN